MKQPLYPSSRALRVIIAAVIMIIANATTAWAQEIGGGGGIELSPEYTPLTLEATVACDITVSNPRSGMKYSVDGGKTMVLMTGTTTPKGVPQHPRTMGDPVRVDVITDDRI